MLRKGIFLALTILTLNHKGAFAQKDKDFSKNWKQVELYEKKGLTASALREVNNIFGLAVVAGNEPQQIKSAMYQMKYRNMVEMDNAVKNIFYIDTLIEKTKAPAKNILQSMQAELFFNYRESHRYILYSRTRLMEEKSNDISTWSIQKLNSTIAALYKLSLQNETVLKNTSISGFSEILQKGVNTRHLRPTLYDLLAHRAISYFINTENDVTEPSYRFILNDEKLFAPANQFVHASFTTSDTSSLYFNAVKIFQDLIKFHLDDKNPEALIDADLSRLAFINEHGIFNAKEKLYEAALKNIETSYSQEPSVAKAMYLRAVLYKNAGNRYDPFIKKEFQYEIKKAKELSEACIKRYPNAEGALNCKNLLVDIHIKSIRLESEKVNIAGQPFRSLLTYRNVGKLYLRLVKTNQDDIRRWMYSEESLEEEWKKTTAMPVLRNWNISLPDLQDHQEHATEIRCDALQNGVYILLASIDPTFELDNNLLAREILYVSNISYLINNQDEMYILDRDHGAPLENATVQVWERSYNNSKRKYEDIKKEKYNTDKNGFVKLTKNTGNREVYSFQVKYKNDELFTGDRYYSRYYDGFKQKKFNTTFFYTDRSIYRPGQKVFFKGIVVNRDVEDKKNDIVANYKTTVLLFDANHQKAAAITVTTNEYGSYNGSFTLPEGKLNGQFRIQDSLNNASHYFLVEEYKRPKFNVEIHKPKGTYRVNDSILVTGNAKAYAGNNIDGAKVTYRVVRKVRYPAWWKWGSRGIWPPHSNNEEMEITNGFTVTNKDGMFSILFKAIPDESIDKKDQPIFYYEVNADVTDINGETRSNNLSISVSYQALQLNIFAADKMPADSLKNIKISSTNMNGLFEKTKVNLIVQKLQAPGRIYRKRYWQMPDQFIISKTAFVESFPHDAYADEDEVNKWPLLATELDITDSTLEDSKFNPGNTIKLNAGWYKITVTARDKYGEEVKDEKYILLTEKDAGNRSIPYTSVVEKDEIAPGEEVNHAIGTGFEKVWLVYSVNKSNSTTNDIYPVTHSKPYINRIKATENDRGGISVGYAFVQHNRVYTGSEFIAVPWADKELSISYETFRDKVLPGSKETWKIKLAGNKAEKITAEALISMYDASLDQFNPHSWQSLRSIWPGLNKTSNWTGYAFQSIRSEEQDEVPRNYVTLPVKQYEDLLNNGWSQQGYVLSGRAMGVTIEAARQDQELSSVVVKAQANEPGNRSVKMPKVPLYDSVVSYRSKDDKPDSPLQNENTNIQVRKNFNETAFFLPEMHTDENGAITFSFTIPEALTKWKMMILGHTKELASMYAEKTVITQKPLMLQPNAPRFVREGDQMEFSAKIVNLSDSEITGTAHLELLDAATNKPVDGWFKNVFPVQHFTVEAGKSNLLKFPVDIPFNFNSALSYRIKASSKNGTFSDGEEAALPVMINRMLVTETMPINMRNETTKHFKFEKLLNSGNSGTLTNHALTVEYTSNPAWYAVQALPYLMEYPYECSEQNFNRFYANCLASFVSNSVPKIKAVFERWKTTDTAALLSNLQKNEELKSVLLLETPWVLAAQNESAQKKNIAILFDMVRLAREKDNSLQELAEMQTGNGGFSWFKGGMDDRYITQYIITGIGHLRKLKAMNDDDYNKIRPIVDRAMPYLDERLKEDFDNLKKIKTNLKANNLSYTAIQYLYMRSFFPEYDITNKAQAAYSYYREQSQQYWLSNNKYMQAMIALALYRTGDNKTPAAIIGSLKENAIYHEEMGMYFKDLATGGYYWYQSPIESQSMIIEAFSDIDNNNTVLDDLKTWLLKQKQTQNWKTTKATSEACYALLLNGNNWLAQEKQVLINAGNMVIRSDDDSEAGTGYFKKTVPGEKIQQGMGNIVVNITSASGQQPARTTSWGAVYWQYFEDLDKISTSATPLKLVKKIFVEKNSDTGPVLQPLNDGDDLHIGDKVKIRIELKADRDMEYVHMKDMRAACMEPVNVISQYKWQGGLGYYESTKNASTNFFFNWLPRGTYVFEYPMFVTHSGNFSNGITSIQCMYAPEFSSHSEGTRVNVAEN